MKKIISTNPAKNYQVLGSIEVSNASEVKEKVALANRAKREWKELGAEKRSELLQPLLAELKKRKREIPTHAKYFEAVASPINPPQKTKSNKEGLSFLIIEIANKRAIIIRIEVSISSFS